MTIYGSSDKKRLKYELRIFRPRNSKQLVLDVMCNDEVIFVQKCNVSIENMIDSIIWQKITSSFLTPSFTNSLNSNIDTVILFDKSQLTLPFWSWFLKLETKTQNPAK